MHASDGVEFVLCSRPLPSRRDSYRSPRETDFVTMNAFQPPQPSEKAASPSMTAHAWLVPGAAAGWAVGTTAQGDIQSTVLKVVARPSFPLIFGLVFLLLTVGWRLPRRIFAEPILPSRLASFVGGFAMVVIAMVSLVQLHGLGLCANGSTTWVTSSIYYSLLTACVVVGVELEAWISRCLTSW